MKPISTKRCRRRNDAGYVLVMMMFFLALLVLSMAVAAPTVLSSIRREKEAEMVWRGRQYVRGIRMFYMKMHKFPASLDDLTKPTNGIRFMRQAYKDPMNTVDGSWRLIFVGPGGQLIGSVNQQTMGMFGALGGAQPGAGLQQAGTGAASSAATSTATSSDQSSGQTGGSATPDPAASDPTLQSANSSGDSSNPQQIGTMDASNVIGGNIIGVGSKVNKNSFLWYKKAKNYKQFEFIWDPSQDIAFGAASRGIGTPIQGGGQGTTAPGAPLPPGMVPSPNQNANPNLNPTLNPPLQAPPNQ